VDKARKPMVENRKKVKLKLEEIDKVRKPLIEQRKKLKGQMLSEAKK